MIKRSFERSLGITMGNVLLATALAASLGACVRVTTTTTTTSETNVNTPSHTGVIFDTVATTTGASKFACFVPRNYTDQTEWPVVIFLNGSGECGIDGQRQLTQGLFPAMINAPEDWPMIALFPQKPDKASQWADHDAMVMSVLEWAKARYRVDASRIYLTGLSQGGAGTWAIGAKHPELFAAIAPICGYGKGEQVAAALKEMPIWAFHGEKDNVVPSKQTKDIITAIEAAGGKPKATYFPDLNHGSWDRAYRDMELGEWLLSQRRK